VARFLDVNEKVLYSLISEKGLPATKVTGEPPAVVNFCRREQGLVAAEGTPKGIGSISDLGRKGIRIANRPRGTGTRLLLDRELQKAGIQGEDIAGYDREFFGDLETCLEVLTGRADAALGMRTVAALLNLDFIPVRWERYDREYRSVAV
jgi:putative molybdopterin biosynthesis protein